MSKNHKKRNKQYTGIDAAPSAPHIRRYSVTEKSPMAQWWQDHKRQVLMQGILVILALLVAWIAYSIIF